MKSFGTWDTSKKTIAIVGDRRSQTMICERFSCNVRKKRSERPNLEMSVRGRNGALSPRGYVVWPNDQGEERLVEDSEQRGRTKKQISTTKQFFLHTKSNHAL